MALLLEEFLSEAISNRGFYFSEHGHEFGDVYYILTAKGAVEVSEHEGEYSVSPVDPSDLESEIDDAHPDWYKRYVVQLGAQHPDGA